MGILMKRQATTKQSNKKQEKQRPMEQRDERTNDGKNKLK